MTLATRCTACATVFRVVQDQLRVSEGWVRCGRCNQVFNAVEHLVDLSRTAPPPSPPPAADSLRDQPAWAASADAPLAFEETAAQRAITADEPVQVRFQAPVSDAAAGDPGDADAGGTTEPEQATGHAADSEPRDAEDEEEEDEDDQETEPADDESAPATVPTFVEAADRAARWQQPGVRRELWAAIVALLLLFALQLAIEYRDFVAARWSGTRPVLETLCRWSGCRVEPPRWIEALAVDSSGLVRVEGTSTYRLMVVLQNRSAMALALPSVDLTLTDSQGRIIARRAFLASELGSNVTSVAPAAELPLQATLSIAEPPVAGYTIEIFYP